MSQGASQINLSELDAPRTHQPDPRILERNIAALAAEQPEFARQLRELRLPDHWQPALALDNTPTYRCEAPGHPPKWLGQTAVPARRAAATLTDALTSAKNVALPCLAAGAELVYLLAQLPPHLAVFVFEDDPRVVAAVLWLHDFYADIARGRCQFLPADRERDALHSLLQKHVGLVPPTNILLKDLVSPERCDAIRTTCEEVGNSVISERNTRLQQLLAQPATDKAAAPNAEHVSLTVLALRPEPALHVHASQLEQAARQLGWPVTCCTTATPYDVDGLVHCEALHAAAPQLTICIDHYANVVPILLPGIKCTWVVREPDGPMQPPDSDISLLAASPHIATDLRNNCADAVQVIDWHWGCSATTDTPVAAGC